jgi:hypothetical protein
LEPTVADGEVEEATAPTSVDPAGKEEEKCSVPMAGPAVLVIGSESPLLLVSEEQLGQTQSEKYFAM